jgi:hypothetical protein
MDNRAMLQLLVGKGKSYEGLCISLPLRNRVWLALQSELCGRGFLFSSVPMLKNGVNFWLSDLID